MSGKKDYFKTSCIPCAAQALRAIADDLEKAENPTELIDPTLRLDKVFASLSRIRPQWWAFLHEQKQEELPCLDAIEKAS